MSVSGGVMANVPLDVALDELGMLSTITNSRQEYLSEQLSRLAALDIPQDLDIRSRNPNGGMRTRASSVSIVNGKRRARRVARYLRVVPSTDRLSRTVSRHTQMGNLSLCLPNEHPSMDPVPYIALPIESSLSSNLFKSRSMESIDAHASDDRVCATERDSISNAIASLAEVDSVSSGLHKLNVNE